jgi:aminopeptidase N
MHRQLTTLYQIALALLFAGCAGEATVLDGAVEEGAPGAGKSDRGAEIASNWERGIDHMWLHLELSDLTGQATLLLEPDGTDTISLEAGGLIIEAVFADRGPLDYEVRDGALHVQLDGAQELSVDYRFGVQDASSGFSKDGSSVIWPTYCGNLFPCRSEPADGLTLEMSVSGYRDGLMALYPESWESEAPAYMVALAVGDYSCDVLGSTTSGTDVSVCWLPGGRDDAMVGTQDLVAVFDWLEIHIGPYTFGSDVASVAAEWGEGAAGGMEHHPYWHVATGEMSVPITHAHEAAHGWFGNGVRMACWEDLVLSEGTVTYLAVRALGAVTSPETEEAVWEDYRAELLWAVENEDVKVLPDSCGEVDLVKDGLWSNVVYMKGAFFFRALAQEVGAEALDAAIADFYLDTVGEARRMVDMLEAIERFTGFDPQPLADHWLRTTGNPF